GAWASHRLRGLVGGGVIQLDADSESALCAQPGYSGSPAVVSGANGDVVVGMLSVASRDGVSRDAYAIPTAQLLQKWPEVLTDLTMPVCPYKGLQAFTEADAGAGLFVGREAELNRLRQMVERHALTVVIGPSGVGKSSLVSAGLIPTLSRSGWTTT